MDTDRPLEEPAEPVDLPRPHVLIVDDRPENLLALESVLEPLDLQITRAESGDDALKAVLTNDFAVILMDVQMPGMDGFEATEYIKSRERSKATPIIFLTAISKDDEYVYRGYDVGAVDYIFKPFQPDILRGKVAVFVDLFQKGEQIRRQEEALHEAEVLAREIRHRDELFESEARFRLVVDSATEAIITFGESRVVDFFNTEASRVFGIPSSEAHDRAIEELFHPTSRDDLRSWIDSVQVGAEHGTEDEESARAPRILTALRPDGDTFPVEASLSGVPLPSENTYTLIGRDISDRVKTERELRDQAEALRASLTELEAVHTKLKDRQSQLEEAMAERSRFYSAMSHELRTPINAILGYNALILEGIYGEVSGSQRSSLERVQTVSNHLLGLVSDILDLSKIESGKFELAPTDVNLTDLVKELFHTVRPLADDNGATLELEAPDHLPLRTDNRRVGQILLNLLSNAVKFGKGHPVRVVCRAGADGGAAVDVIDEGPGIAEENLQKVFDEFVQLRPDGEMGTGLGLSISRRLARVLGGALTLESELGMGSTFTLELPATVEAAEVVG